jgi:hypothetical protein
MHPKLRFPANLIGYVIVVAVATADLLSSGLLDSPELAFIDSFLASAAATFAVSLLEWRGVI